MKRIAFIAACGIASLTGCATVPPQAAVADEARIDTQRVAQIDRAARGTGSRLYWIHYPLRKVERADVIPTLGEPTGT